MGGLAARGTRIGRVLLVQSCFDVNHHLIKRKKQEKAYKGHKRAGKGNECGGEKALTGSRFL